MNKRRLLIVITAVILTSIVSGSIGAVTVLAWPYTDISPGDWFYTHVDWADWWGIVNGYPDGTFRPNNGVTRAEAVTMLHREAGFLVPAGFHVVRGAGDVPVIDKWFNNVNGVMPVITGAAGDYDINVGFSAAYRFAICSVDTNWVDTRDAFCTVSTPGGNTVRVRIYDVSVGGQAPAEFWVIVYGDY